MADKTDAHGQKYFDRFEPDADYEKVMYADNRFVQGRELNESQSILGHRVKGVGDAIMSDGNVLSGGEILTDPQTGAVTLGAAEIYANGIKHNAAPASFIIPIDRLVEVGIRVVADIVTSVEDPSLRGLVGGPTFGEQGASRLKVAAAWGWDGDGLPGDFYPVYRVDHGVVIDQNAPPQFDPINSALARYDREANGHYVVEGVRVVALGLTGDSQEFSIGDGTVNVYGYKHTRSAALRITQVEEPDIREVAAEPHAFTDGGSGTVEITLNHSPIAAVTEVTILREATEAVTHGAASGDADALINTSVAQIMSVQQGATTYQAGTDYTLTADTVDWSPGGSEPAPGSSYDVNYRYYDNVTPDVVAGATVTVSGAVTGTTVLIDYRWKLPRTDSIALDRYSDVHYIKGQSSEYAPFAPSVPPDMIKLADIDNAWGGFPVVRNVATHSLYFKRLAVVLDVVEDLYDLVAQERLKTDVAAREPTSKRGVFVDPFLDDDLRDQGLAQTAAITGEDLRLPIEATIVPVDVGTDAYLLAHDEEVILAQEYETGASKINPYQAFQPLPARVTLDPAADIWTEINTQWASDVTNTIVNGWGNRSTQSTAQQIQTIRSETTEARFMRVRTVTFTVEGFGPNEQLTDLTFDGVDITPA